MSAPSPRFGGWFIIEHLKGEADRNRCADPLLGFDIDRPTKRFDDGLNDGHAQTGAQRLHLPKAVVGLKDGFDLVFRYANAGVDYGDFQRGGLIGPRLGARFHKHAALLGELHRIGQEVHQNLTEARLVEADMSRHGLVDLARVGRF